MHKSHAKIFAALCFIILILWTGHTSAELSNSSKTAKVPHLLMIKDDLGTVAEYFLEDLRSMGYAVNEVIPDFITPELVAEHDLTILCTGTNPNPCQNIFMRNILISHANSGGKVLVEGGENVYVSAVFPGYAAFLNKVLKGSAWESHNSGNFIMNSDYQNSTIANVPNILPTSIGVTAGNNYYQDVCTRMETSLLLYKCQSSQNAAGVLVFPDIDDVQIINLCFSYNAVDRSTAKNLIGNFLNALVGSPIGIVAISNTLPETFRLHDNYPNPFNSSTTVRFSVSQQSKATMKIFSAEGKLVSVVFSRRFEPGEYSVNIDLPGLPSGIYFLVFESEKFRGRIKLSLVK